MFEIIAGAFLGGISGVAVGLWLTVKAFKETCKNLQVDPIGFVIYKTKKEKSETKKIDKSTVTFVYDN